MPAGELTEDPRERAKQMATVRWRSNFRQINPEATSIHPPDGAARTVSCVAENISDTAADRFL